MATWYVNSAATGSGAGTSWTNACTTLAAAISLSAAGDDFDVLSTHAESTAGNLTLAFKGTAAAPNRVFSCDNTNNPAQASDLLSGASITTTGASTLTLYGFVYVYGVTISCGSGANAGALNIDGTQGTNSEITLDGCKLAVPSTVASTINPPVTTGKLTLNNTTMSFGAPASCLTLQDCAFTWKNTPSAIAGTCPSILISPQRHGTYVLDGVDLSNVTSGKAILSGSSGVTGSIQLVNCKLAPGAAIATGITLPGVAIDLINSDSAATGNRQERYQYQGILTTESTIIRAGGASDDVAAMSWKVVTSANAKAQSPFECFEIATWVDGAGSHTATIEVITDNVILANTDLWVEAQYLGGASNPLASTVSAGPATQLTAGTNLGASSASWTTTGLTTPKPQNITVSFTTATKGFVRLAVRIAKASLTVRVDPYPTVT